jgi:flavin-binding protein dodecin
VASANTFIAAKPMVSGIPMPRPNETVSMKNRGERDGRDGATRHEHRTAKVVELIGTSSKSFEDAVRSALKDASETTRGITGAHVDAFSVRCHDGKITEYKASLKVAFGIERT